ncbi:MAG: thermonuclease family protein [Pseudomonadota bacterium]
MSELGLRYRRGRRKFRDYATAFLLLVGVATAAAFLDARNTQSFEGSFVAVDGDSLQRAGQRFRLFGIDAPELRQTCRRDGTKWRCGVAARDALRKAMGEEGAVCRGSQADRFGRLLVRCESGYGSINARMVANGMAVSFGAYEREESLARDARRGIWATDFSRPRDWREANREAARLRSDMAETIHSATPSETIRDWISWARDFIFE